MPADGDDTTTLHMRQQLIVDTGKWYAVEVLVVTHLDTSQIESHHGRIVTNGQLHVALTVFVSPTDAIERIILMSGHITFLIEGVHTLLQLLSQRLLRLRFLLRFTAHYRNCGD